MNNQNEYEYEYEYEQYFHFLREWEKYTSQDDG